MGATSTAKAEHDSLMKRSIDNAVDRRGPLQVLSSDSSPKRETFSTIDIPFWTSVLLACALLAFAVTSTSLWIDEGIIAGYLDHQSFHSLLQKLAGPFPYPDQTDRQYPLYDIWLWGWTRLFASSEYALRAANIPFAVLFVVALALTSRLVLERRFAWIPFAFAPFVWFYTNEARPYMMLAAAATATLGAALIYTFGPERFRRPSIWALCFALVLSCLSHILTILALPGLVIIALAAMRGGRAPRWAEWRVPLLLCGPVLLATAVYYVTTMSGASGRAEIEMNHPASPAFGSATIAYAAQIIYEHVGFGGLGPPRNELRTSIKSVHGPYLWWLAFGVAGLMFAGYHALRKPHSKTSLVLLLAWAVAFSVAIGLTHLLHVRFLGRHLAAVLPFVLFGGMSLCRSRPQLLAIALVFCVSDIRLSALPEYWKDDYRSAVQDVVNRLRVSPGSIDWAADKATANYYGLALDRQIGSGPYTDVHKSERARGVDVRNLCARDIAELLSIQHRAHRPVYLALSKPDLFDRCAGWKSVIAQKHAEPIAEYRTFNIYEVE